MFILGKFSLVITTRCNLRCELCCEYVPQNKPFPDMTLDEAKAILSAAFNAADSIGTLHLTGGGEPFLHPQLSELIEVSMEYSDRFNTLMLFTNSTIMPSDDLLDTMKRHKEKILLQISHYGIKPERENDIMKTFLDNGIKCKVEKYYGEDQSFGGWVDFGKWEPYNRTSVELEQVFRNCAITRDMKGNWRTRNGKVHWCSRSMRGMELGLIPDCPDDYVDLLDVSEGVEAKRERFKRIELASSISSCDYCAGVFGSEVIDIRRRAAEQMSSPSRI